MNLLHAVSWYYTGSESGPRAFYGRLRQGAAQGKRFPIDCPYEVALVRVEPRPDSYWLVAVLAMRSGAADDSVDTVNQIQRWFEACGASGYEDKESRRSINVSVERELGDGYEVVESFGTFVGEPDPQAVEEPAKVVEAAPALETVPAADPEPIAPLAAEPAQVVQSIVTALSLPAPDPVVQPEPSIPLPTPIPAPARSETYTPPVPRAASGGNGATSCLAWGLAIVGGLMALGGLITGAFFIFAQLISDDPTSNLEGFLWASACFPLPLFLIGAALLALGIFILRRKKTA